MSGGARAKAESTDAVKRGVGVAPMFFIPLGSPKDKAEARIELKEDGRFYVYNTYHEMGQGGDIGSLAAALEVLSPLNLKPGDIQLDINDSKDCPDSGISAGSRSHFMNASAIREAGKLLLDDLLVLLGFFFFLELLETELAVVHDLADRGNGVRRDLD